MSGPDMSDIKPDDWEFSVSGQVAGKSVPILIVHMDGRVEPGPSLTLADAIREAIGGLNGQIREMGARAEKLQAFKDYVHQRLDEAGVPTHPEGPHSAAGCRVGDRLDIAFARAQRAEEDARASETVRSRICRAIGRLSARHPEMATELAYAMGNPHTFRPQEADRDFCELCGQYLAADCHERARP